MKPKRIALIFSTVWPEPQSSAAGVRQLQWVSFLSHLGYEVILSSPAKQVPETHSNLSDLNLLPLPLNRSEVKETLIKLNPEIVMFDRFILEEQFGHFVYESCPKALVLLETQDLHFVRRAREKARETLLTAGPDSVTYRTETALRETASILRVDYSYVVSSDESRLLQSEFGIGEDKVSWIPFSYDEPVILSQGFETRKGFCWIGNFRHAPNVDGLRWFLKEIWPKVRASLPDVRIRIHGAYPSVEVMQWNKPENGIEVEGSAPDLETVFHSARVNLAPLRFGAGVKGKILEGFRRGIPCVTTWVGKEGILSEGSVTFPGLISNDAPSFAESCIRLYQDQKLWEECASRASFLMNETYHEEKIFPLLEVHIQNRLTQKKEGRLPVWTSQILRHELLNSHKYFSKWIEVKEKAQRED